ncbi:sensor histidine kinase [Paucibacter sp. XJ19-41]|uniref:sensor histidine kinase n=1 Tax=Paucibacter sp. XJ19-41 TaxID=2927824 RepID=UPI00234A177B|nr:histidine kinase [Paucibacter sp. XJ19-41]MDC6167390.1 histidine kinase [Paucibacter sp. XJ19-41]
MHARQRHLLIAAYLALVLGLGLLQGLAELQHYLAAGGRHPWEPLLWELSSTVCTGALGLALYRWHVAGLGLARWRQLGRHLLGLLVYILAHVAGMFAIRFAVYAVMGLNYRPGSALAVLSYEAAKDIGSYALMLAICHGLHLFFADQRREQELQRLRGALAEAQLARLTEQVQPHFLFNTLNLISSVMYEDVARADRMLCQLADLLRQNLAAQAQGWHSLADELRLVEPFLVLMQARFGERLRVTIEADAQARECRLPALLLISPVENAIKHDVAQSSAAVEVGIRATLEQQGQVLRLEVINSGQAPLRSERAGAIGLANLRERLHSSFGAAASCSLDARPEGGARLLIRLPAQVQVVA